MKYIISQDQFEELAALASAYESPALQQLTYELKPVEPLDNPTIKSIMVANGFKTYPEVGDDLKPYCYAAVRAIEHHILGETP